VIVTVVGAGVCGLTAGIRLAETGHTVHVRASELALETTSATAGAIWGPYRVGPRDLVTKWSVRSLAALTELASQPGTGVRIGNGVQAARFRAGPPWWHDLAPEWQEIEPGSLPPGYLVGWRFRAPVVDMPTYLRYLTHRLLSLGGTIQRGVVQSLGEAGRPGGVVVNCAGAGASTLTVDPLLRPVRGQHVVVANPGLTEFFTEDSGDSPELTGIYPQGPVVVLGGTAIDMVDSRKPDPEAAARIVSRCAGVDPRLADAPVIAHRVGVRPVRPTIRLAVETLAGGRRCIHNYGHGGAGVTVAWGCADEIVRILHS
jgi:D-amino-acid oxidase